MLIVGFLIGFRVTGRYRYLHLFVYFISFFLRTLWSRVLENLTDFQLAMKFPDFFGTEIHYHIHKCPSPVPILSQLDTVHATTSHVLKIHLNIILPSTPGFAKWSLSLWFPQQRSVYASLLPNSRYMPRLSRSRFYHPNDIG
jgi:hypothetical protein